MAQSKTLQLFFTINQTSPTCSACGGDWTCSQYLTSLAPYYYSQSLTHYYSHSLAHSLTHSLTHSSTPSLSPSLTVLIAAREPTAVFESGRRRAKTISECLSSSRSTPQRGTGCKTWTSPTRTCPCSTTHSSMMLKLNTYETLSVPFHNHTHTCD